ncbi:MAG: 4-(cytidine 5'-diphospho)-2-C-methyl-D-erythritol kinase [Bacteroidetes bacterium]|nr:4-(cytidine 5'-diphospho)-2-C-methyl-D-erythritol kinase [Bacteroidota bacterium]
MENIFHSNCKINLGLNVISRRTDGYHNIESLMFPVKGLYDTITIVPRKDNEVNFFQKNIVVDCLNEDNLCVKAYRMLMIQYGISGADMTIEKNIPFGAGLGGGSSNAAYVLKSANEVFGLGISNTELLDIAKHLGCDTSFFIENKAVIVEGKGDLMSPIDISLEGYHLTLIKPNFSVSTQEAYRGVRASLPEKTIKKIVTMDINNWKNYLKNDFETSVFKKYPLLEEIKKSLYKKGAILAMMSGSGSTIYAISETSLDINEYVGKMFTFSTIL